MMGGLWHYIITKTFSYPISSGLGQSFLDILYSCGLHIHAREKRHDCLANIQAYVLATGLYALYLKGQGHQGIFFLKLLKLYWSIFKGTEAMTRGHDGGNRKCLHEVSGLDGILFKFGKGYLNKIPQRLFVRFFVLWWLSKAGAMATGILNLNRKVTTKGRESASKVYLHVYQWFIL